MTTYRGRSDLQGLGVLLRAGSAAGLSDGRLLECFATRSGEVSELAFAALVERHGPMVLRTCQAILRDEHDAGDAFQATFLVLARRGGALWVRDSIGPWLHRVARRAATRTLRQTARRRLVETVSALTGARRNRADSGHDDLAAVVHEEIDRLPEHYRVPVVLCDLQGRTHEEAARHLGCPVGTVKSRLTRGRERLRGRLTRRGLAPETALPPLVRTVLPQALVESTTRAAAGLALAGARSVPSAVAAGVVTELFLNHLRTATMKAMLAASIGAGLLLAGVAVRARQEPEPAKEPRASAAAGRTGTATPASGASSHDWSRTDGYEPPDFARFFPDDPEGGRALDALWADPKRDERPAAEVIATVRKGIRRTSADAEKILAWVGSRFIWNASSQNRDAIEILYHATDFRGPWTRYGESPAIYYGLMRIAPEPPAVLHALVDWCMHVDCFMDWQWAAHAARAQRAEILAYLKPYLGSGDLAVRDRAAVVAKVLGDAADRNTAYTAWSAKIVRAKCGHKLPDVKHALAEGSSAERQNALELIQTERLTLIMDESFLPAFRACAGDRVPDVRRKVTQVVGGVATADGRTSREVIDILLGLSKDEDQGVRYDAVYYGLTPLPTAAPERVARRLVDMAESDRILDLPARIVWGLQHDRDLAARLLDEDLRGPDAARAAAALAVYQELTGRTPPGLKKVSDETRKGYLAAFRDLYDHLGRVYPCFGLKGIDWSKVGDELLPRARDVATEEQFGTLVLELVARLEDSHATVIDGTATPPWPSLPEWDPSLACLIDDRGRPVLYVVPQRSAAWTQGVRPGMTVVSVNGVPAAEAMSRWMQKRRKSVGFSSERYLRYEAARWFHRQPERGAKITLELEDIDGRKRTVALTAEARGWYIPRLPVPVEGINDGGADVQWVKRKDGIGYLFVRRIRPGLEVLLDQALAALGDVEGLIVDVRGNSGGGFNAETALRNFDVSVHGAGGSGKPRYTGPIALLIDERCISAGEGWASWFIANKRARLFGATSAGASARKETYRLTNGLYQVVVPVKAYTGFLDRPIERRGLEPDVAVRCTARDVADGRDTVAEAAADWLKQTGRK